MTMDFDRVVERMETGSYKWDQVEALFGDRDILPMWVADMDFPAPPAVVDAVTERARHGVYGYTARPASYYEAVQGWLSRRHGWEVPREWIGTAPGVVTAIAVILNEFTQPGDGIIVQSPVYHSFYHVIEGNDRRVVENPLVLENGRYRMDYEDLERKLADGAKMMILCSPHNPGGRVWTPDELRRVGDLCLQYNVPVIADEIHFDLVFKEHRHTVFASISEAFAQNSFTTFSPSKTFNIAGLQSASLLSPNDSWRRRYLRRLGAYSLNLESYFGMTATEVAYNEGDEWLDALMDYLQESVDLVRQYLQQHMPKIRLIEPEATYLLWLDCRELGMSPAELKEWMYREAKVALNEGSSFGTGGEGFLRMNIACPRSMVEECLKRMHQAYERISKP
jgi:cysteine-S-conjugate beta-lyase